MYFMQISFLGNYCFKLKGKSATAVIGILQDKIQQTNAQVVVLPGQRLDSANNYFENTPFYITAPGEYEISNISVLGYKGIYIIDIDEIKIGFINPKKEDYSDEELEEIEEIDVLLLLLGDNDFKNEKAAKLVAQVQPKILIPTDHNKISELLKEIGQEVTNKETKLTIEKSSLPEETTVVILQ